MDRRLPILTIVLVLATLLASSGVSALEHDVSLTLEDPTNIKTWDGENPVLFNFTVANIGSGGQDDVKVAVSGRPEKWTHVLTADTYGGIVISTVALEMTLRDAEVADLVFAVTPTVTTPVGSYPVNVTSFPTATPELERTVTVIVVIPHFPRYHIELRNSPPNMTYLAIPPSTVTVQLALYNTGNAADRFRVRVSLDQWNWELGDGVNEQGWTPLLDSDITRLSPHYIEVRVSVPADAVAGTNATIVVSAVSGVDASYQGPSAQARIEALQYHNFQVFTLGPTAKDGLPGETVTYELEITNWGNGPDTFNVKAFVDPMNEGLFRAWTEPARATIPAYGSVTVMLMVEVMEGVPTKTYFLTVQVHMVGDFLPPNTKSFELSVGQLHRARAETANGTVDSRPGGWANFTVSVRNTGNGVDVLTMDLVGVPEGWIPYVQPPDMVLLPDEAQDVRLSLRVPHQLAQPALVKYRMTLNVTSGGTVLASVPLAVRLPVIHRVELGTEDDVLTSPGRPELDEVKAGLHWKLDLYEGETVNLSLHVWNMGNVIDNATVTAWTTAQGLGVDVYPGVVHVGVGFKTALRVEVRAPGAIRPGNYVVWVNASSEDAGEATRSVPLGVEVVAPLPPTLFSGLAYVDDPRDDYLFHREGEGGAMRGAFGKLDTDASVDIISLQSSLDVTTGVLTVTVELRGEASTDEGTFYYLFFVREGHVQPGELLSPMLHQFRHVQYNRSSPGSTITLVHVTFDANGTPVAGRPMDWGFGDLEVLVQGDKVVFKVTTRDLREAGVEAGTPLALYALSERTRSQGGGDWVEELTWDAAGEGAADAPAAFSDMPSEGVSGASMIGVAILLAVLALLGVWLLLRRRGGRAPQPETYKATLPTGVVDAGPEGVVDATPALEDVGVPAGRRSAESEGWEEFE